MAENKTETSLAEKEPTTAERFTSKVLTEFKGQVGDIQLTDYHKNLVQHYFIAIDRALKATEQDRIQKNSYNNSKKNDLPCDWQHIDLQALAVNTVHYARLGLDMLSDNHLFPIPFKNNKKNIYDITFMKGYNGIKYIAENYAVDKPDAVTIEVVYETDVFVMYKKGKDIPYDDYEFHVKQPFNRGKIIGGFGYIHYHKAPSKNKLIVLNMEDVEKRKPSYAAAEFWGGEKSVYNYKTKQKENKQIAGWEKEMVEKTIIRAVYHPRNIPIDPKAVADSMEYMKLQELQYAQQAKKMMVEENAGQEFVDIPYEAADDKQLKAPEDEGVNPPDDMTATTGIEAAPLDTPLSGVDTEPTAPEPPVPTDGGMDF